MKKLIIIAIAAMCAVQSYAQGTVTFNNASTSVITNSAGASLPAAGITVGLYFAPAGTVLESAFALQGTTTIAPVPGRFTGGTRVLTGIAEGAQAAIQIRAWSGAFATYELAALASSDGVTQIGKSSIFTVTTGAPTGAPPTSPAALAPLTKVLGATTVPEPSSIALGLLGLGAVALFRRRK